jgi:hypothetical protein
VRNCWQDAVYVHKRYKEIKDIKKKSQQDHECLSVVRVVRFQVEVFITEMKSVYSAVRTGDLNTAVCG